MRKILISALLILGAFTLKSQSTFYTVQQLEEGITGDRTIAFWTYLHKDGAANLAVKGIRLDSLALALDAIIGSGGGVIPPSYYQSIRLDGAPAVQQTAFNFVNNPGVFQFNVANDAINGETEITGTITGSNINPGSSAIVITNGTGAALKTVTVDIDPSQIDLTDLGGTLSLTQINQSGATAGQVIQWNGSTWVAGTVAGGGSTYTAGVGIDVTGTVISNIGDVSIVNEGALSVYDVSSTQVDIGSNTLGSTNVKIIDGSGINITANPGTNTITVTNTGDTDGSDDLTTSTIYAGDVAGVYNNLQIQPGVVGSTELASGSVTMIKINQAGATTGQVIKWNGSAWAPATDGGSGASTWGSIGGTLSAQTDLQTALDNKVTKNADIVGATRTKITYDAKGLVTAGANATTSDIAEGSNLYYTNERAQDGVFSAVIAGTGIGINYNDAANTFTITNSAPDQTVVLNNGTGINITGTSPNFTINATGIGLTDGDKGDITISGTGTVFTIDPSTVTSAKILDATISFGDIAQNSATTGQIPKWNGSAWVASTDDAGVGGSATPDNITIIGAGTVPSPLKVGTIDSTNVTDYSLNLRDIESAQAPNKNVMVYNGSRWVPATPDYGNVFRDSVSSRTRPYFEVVKDATVSSSQIDWDGDSTANLVTTLTANTALSVPTHIRNGGRYSITVKQDAVGGWGLSLPSTILLDDGASINTQALSTSVLDCTSDGTNMYCSVTRYGQNEGYNLLNTYYDSLDLYLVPGDFGNAFRLNNNFDRTKGISTVTGYNQRIFEYTEQSRNAFLLASYGNGQDTTEPKTAYIDGRIAWNFDGANDYFALRGSNTYTQLQSGDFTIAFWLRSTQDGAFDFIFSNNLGGGTAGWSINRTAANKVNFYMETSAGSSVNYSSTATITASSGWQWIVIRRSGNTGYMKVGDATEETFSITPRTAEAYPNIIAIGSYGSLSSNWLTGQMGNCFFFRRNMAATTLARFKNYNPAAPNIAPTALVRTGTFAPDKITGLDLWFDFSTVSTLKKDASGATAVTTNGDNIRRVNTRNITTLNKYVLSPGSAQDPVYNTAQQNGLSASTWQSTDRMLYSTETELPVWEGQKSFFIVFKSTDTLSYRNLFSDGAANLLVVSRPGSSFKQGSQNPIFSPLDSFRGNESYVFASLIRMVQWNVLEYRHRGNKWYMSVNGGNYVICTQTNHSWIQTMLSHPSSNQFIGSIGEVVSYNTFLTNPQADLVVGYLCAKWGITRESTIPTDADADAGRITMIDYRTNPAIDYVGFPVATIRLDTLWIAYTKSTVHNDSYGSQEGSFLRPFSPRTLLPIGPEIVSAQDQLTGTLLNRGMGGYNWLPDGRIIFSGTEYDGQSSPGGRDTINGIFRIRSLAGVMGSYTKITHPVLTRFFAIVDKIHIVGSNWYVVGYGAAIGEARYSVSILKSTNSGTSWTQVARWNGNSIFGGTDPEEPVLLQTYDGRWQMYYRDDEFSQMYLTSTADIDTWDQTAGGLTLIGPGQSRPGVIEMSDKTLVMSVRIIPPSNQDLGPTYWYSSKDGGRTWINRGGLDLVRERVGWANMYSTCVDRGNGECVIMFGAENGFNGLSGGQISNISGKIVKP